MFTEQSTTAWILIVHNIFTDPALKYLNYPLTLDFCVTKKNTVLLTTQFVCVPFAFESFPVSFKLCWRHVSDRLISGHLQIQLWWHAAKWPAEVTAHQNHQPEIFFIYLFFNGASPMVCTLSCYASTPSLPLAWGRNELKAETWWTSKEGCGKLKGKKY